MPDLSDIGIFISAVGGIIVIYEKMTKKREHFIVKYDSYNAEMDDRDSLYIVSKSFQPISIRDYGFIKENGELESIPWIGECACDGDNYDIVKLGVTEKNGIQSAC